jgi:hypothetical protein
MKMLASRSLLVLELLGLLIFDLVVCGMMLWIGDSSLTPLRLLIVALFLLLLWSSGATILRAADYLRGNSVFDDEPSRATRVLSLAVPASLVAVVVETVANPSERIAQLTTTNMLLYAAAATPAIHLEVVAWLRKQATQRFERPSRTR